MPLPGSTDASQAASGGSLPGQSIDDLRAQGKAAEARAEFERLLQEGMESGVDPRTPGAICDAVRAEIGNRASSQTSDAAAQSNGTAGAQG